MPKIELVHQTFVTFQVKIIIPKTSEKVFVLQKYFQKFHCKKASGREYLTHWQFLRDHRKDQYLRSQTLCQSAENVPFYSPTTQHSLMSNHKAACCKRAPAPACNLA